MKTIYKKAACSGLALVVLFVSNLALADSDYDRAQQLHKSGEILSLETILQKLQTSHPGKVLEVEMEDEHGQLIYEIELLNSNGKVKKIKVNAKTGDLFQQEKDD